MAAGAVPPKAGGSLEPLQPPLSPPGPGLWREDLWERPQSLLRHLLGDTGTERSNPEACSDTFLETRGPPRPAACPHHRREHLREAFRSKARLTAAVPAAFRSRPWF